jgi:nucleotide-binding universal stress UspA family protein
MDETSRNIGEKRLREYLRERAESAFQEILDQAGLRCEVLLRGGSLPQRLALTARQQRADLVIIGRGHLRKNLGRLRTNTLAIVSQSPCPVISV